MRLIGRKFPAIFLLPLFLYMAEILADFQSSGIVPVSRDLLKMISKGVDIALAVFLKNNGWKPSGPGDLLTFSC